MAEKAQKLSEAEQKRAEEILDPEKAKAWVEARIGKNGTITKELVEEYARTVVAPAWFGGATRATKPVQKPKIKKDDVYSPSELASFLTSLWCGKSAMVNGVAAPVPMLWGPPGIGKSSIVRSAAKACGLEVIDLRLSQLAPTDLRGVPVPDKRTGRSQFYAPDFLPTEGRGVLFLDEINGASTAMMLIAQQLLLDRQVGNYVLPDGWFLCAAGNRRSDGASVNTMPQPVNNRLIHLTVRHDVDDWLRWGSKTGISPEILMHISISGDAKKSGENTLLFRPSDTVPNWPSPRSWEAADKLHKCGLSVTPAIGEAAATTFYAFLSLPWCAALLDWANGDGNPPVIEKAEMAHVARFVGYHSDELIQRAQEDGLLSGEMLALAKKAGEMRA